MGNQIANGVRAWAESKGVTHYTHWFQPLTDLSAEKHDSFFTLKGDGTPIEEFEGTADPNYGTLKNAINIPIQELANRLSEIESLKTKEIIVFCSHSHRSPRASYLLIQNGFTDVTNMAGGMNVLKDNSCKK